MGIVALAGRSTATVKAKATLSLRTGFALNHLRVAADSARRAHAVECANATAPFGPWFDAMLMLVPVSVVMAGAALEAGSNELLQDFLDGSTSMELTPSRRKLLKDLKDDRSGNSLTKYRRLALLMDRDPDDGTEPWHNARLLVKFRNEFMHFRPSWDHEGVHTGSLVAELRKKISVVDVYKKNFLFPYGFMTYDCAKWSVQTVLTFSADFSKLLGVQDKFVLRSQNFTLP